MLSPIAWLLLGAVLVAVIDSALNRAASNVLKGWSFGEER